MTDPSTRSRRRATWFIAVAIAAVALAGPPPTRADDPPAATPQQSAPLPPLETIRDKLGVVRSQIQSSKIRLTNSVVGLQPDGATPNASPVRQCCMSNLQKIDGAIRAIDRSLAELTACYGDRGMDDATSSAQLARVDLDALVGAMRQFAGTPAREQAVAALGPVTRGYLNLEKSSDKLEACDSAASDASDAD